MGNGPTEGDTGMVADLDLMTDTALTAAPSGFVIEEVEDEVALADFERVFAAGFKMSRRIAHGWTEAALRVGVGRTPWRMFLGRLRGAPVATSILFPAAHVLGVYGVAALPEVRGQGIGGAMVVGPLLRARSAGYRHAVLSATPLGIGTYTRIGFSACDVRLCRYLWRNI